MASNSDDAAEAHALPGLAVSPGSLHATLQTQIERGEQLLRVESPSKDEIDSFISEYSSWHEYNRTLLRRSFTTAEIAEEYARTGPMVFAGSYTIADQFRDTKSDLRESIRRLKSVQDQIKLYSETPPAAPSRPEAGAQEVFIVHGHDEAAKLDVARFVEQVTGRPPIILHEQSNNGRTVIEKFEEYASSAGFAIILLTPDDEGRARTASDSQFRARQNVIFEFGFFVGSIGRPRVAALHRGGVELPSDLSGVLYTSLDSEWRMELGREMRDAGIDVDLNKAR